MMNVSVVGQRKATLRELIQMSEGKYLEMQAGRLNTIRLPGESDERLRIRLLDKYQMLLDETDLPEKDVTETNVGCK